MTKEELEIAKAACCVGTIWDAYSGKENFDHMVGLRVKHLIKLVRNYQQPFLPSDLDEAAHSYSESDEPLYSPGHRFHWDNESLFGKQIETTFKAGAEWMAGQGWISVDEKLPKMDEEVIVLTDEFGTAPIYKIAFGHIVDVERCIDYNGWNIPGVKYWMPCPEIPNE